MEGWLRGLKLGLAINIIAVILDVAITVPVFVQDYALFFNSVSLWLGILISIFTFIIGSVIFKNKRIKEPVSILDPEEQRGTVE